MADPGERPGLLRSLCRSTEQHLIPTTTAAEAAPWQASLSRVLGREVVPLWRIRAHATPEKRPSKATIAASLVWSGLESPLLGDPMVTEDPAGVFTVTAPPHSLFPLETFILPADLTAPLQPNVDGYEATFTRIPEQLSGVAGHVGGAEVTWTLAPLPPADSLTTQDETAREHLQALGYIE